MRRRNRGNTRNLLLPDPLAFLSSPQHTVDTDANSHSHPNAAIAAIEEFYCCLPAGGKGFLSPGPEAHCRAEFTSWGQVLRIGVI